MMNVLSLAAFAVAWVIGVIALTLLLVVVGALGFPFVFCVAAIAACERRLARRMRLASEGPEGRRRGITAARGVPGIEALPLFGGGELEKEAAE